AIELLTDAVPAIDAAAPPEVRARAHGLLGRAYVQTGEFLLAEPQLRAALELAQQAESPSVTAAEALNDLGLMHSALKSDVLALAEYAKAVEAAEAAHQPAVAARALLNAADLHHRRGDDASSAKMAERAALAVDG